ncbi:MAG: LysR family transcriptional regulator [Alphaproteobacteria bacterium]|nr:LysR family transcriptional regulator [Alphaproteobacteria bacterium]
MQRARNASLNALRVFAMAAECGSHKKAAARLGVTPGAVSHQVRSLETAIGAPLFLRSNNSLRLTEVGETLFTEAAPALTALERAVKNAATGVGELSIQAPLTFAIRWLIPRLDAFQAIDPSARVRIETVKSLETARPDSTDISIAYHPIGAAPSGLEPFLEDRCRPYLSPGLLAKIDRSQGRPSVPALQSTAGNWDWRRWLALAGSSPFEVTYVGSFDFDDAALRAAIAGFGMVLSPAFMIQDDLDAKRLCPYPDAPEALLGLYTLERRGPPSRQTDRVLEWLRALGADLR